MTYMNITTARLNNAEYADSRVITQKNPHKTKLKTIQLNLFGNYKSKKLSICKTRI